MPIKYKDWSHRFKWQLADTGEPIGLLVDIGGALWLAVCPLCGCAHQHGAWAAGQSIKPACMGNNGYVWANWRHDWTLKHPGAKDARTVYLQVNNDVSEVDTKSVSQNSVEAITNQGLPETGKPAESEAA